jgi:hypothetical protein
MVYYSYLKRVLLCIAVLLSFMISQSFAQITPPGFEREVELYKKQRSGSIMDREKIIVIDTSLIIDPDTFKETVKVTRDTITLREYCEGRLGVQNADRLLDGRPHKITNPITYEDMIIRWNRGVGKLDTLPNNQK